MEDQIAQLPAGTTLAVLGDPVSHSLSPAMQNAGLQARGLPHRYGRLRVDPPGLGAAFAALRRSFVGWNVTLPLKVDALAHVDALDAEARRLGALNTVTCRDGILTGHNTDGIGLQRALDEAFGPGWAREPVTILGAGGGAGSAVTRHLARTGVSKLVLVNRNVERAVAVAQSLSPGAMVDIRGWDRLTSALAAAPLVINASSVGLDGVPLGWDPAWLGRGQRVFDLIYSREPTPVVAWARAAGAEASDGLGMLLHQGVAAFALWFGEPVPVAAMRAALWAAAGR